MPTQIHWYFWILKTLASDFSEQQLYSNFLFLSTFHFFPTDCTRNLIMGTCLFLGIYPLFYLKNCLFLIIYPWLLFLGNHLFLFHPGKRRIVFILLPCVRFIYFKDIHTFRPSVSCIFLYIIALINYVSLFWISIGSISILSYICFQGWNYCVTLQLRRCLHIGSFLYQGSVPGDLFWNIEM